MTERNPNSKKPVFDNVNFDLSFQNTSLEVKQTLDETINTPEMANLGEITVREDIRSSIGPFQALPDYKTIYPDIVTNSLSQLYDEYNQAFRPLVNDNREWDTDYQYCITPEGTPTNSWVQIDMVGLPDKFLDAAPDFNQDDVKEALRNRIFEFENSIAMYQLLQHIFANNNSESQFKTRFRSSMDAMRQKYHKPIALLAVTDQKYQAMKESEFGKIANESLTDEEVSALTGFDRFFGPGEFQNYLNENGGNCDYLLFARTSDPLVKLKDPNAKVSIPLLENDHTRQVIKANAITFNIDDPSWSNGDPRRINDTKAYLPDMGMGYAAYSEEDLTDLNLVKFLLSSGVDLQNLKAGETVLRAKPLQHSYGCYGHERGKIDNNRFWKDVRAQMRKRGPYVIQPEMPNPTIINSADGSRYMYIDRNFFSTDGKNFTFMGGFRSLMPMNTVEAEKGRVHGNSSTVWAEIL